MFLPEELKSLIQEVMAQVYGQSDKKRPKKNDNEVKSKKISPAQALVVAGLLSGVLEVTSILVDKDQVVQIVLAGYLKEETTKVGQAGKVSFDHVMESILDRLR